MQAYIQLLYYQKQVINTQQSIQHEWYAITITPIGKKVSMATVITRFKQLANLKSIDYVAVIPEVSPAGVNHLHGIIQVRKLNKFTKIKNLVMLTKRLYGIAGWTRYITKHNPTELYTIERNTFQGYHIDHINQYPIQTLHIRNENDLKLLNYEKYQQNKKRNRNMSK